MNAEERKQLLAEEWAKNKARAAPMVPIKPTLDKQIGPLMASYQRYIEREANEMGVPVEELQDRIDRMKEWAEFCIENPEKAARDSKQDELFGDRSPPEALPRSGVSCEKCRDSGEYFDDRIYRRRFGQAVGPFSAYIFCDCNAGNERRDYVKNMGSRRKKKRAEKKGLDGAFPED